MDILRRDGWKLHLNFISETQTGYNYKSGVQIFSNFGKFPGKRVAKISFRGVASM